MNADPETATEMMTQLWRKCMTAARNVGSIEASVVQDLIGQSRDAIRKMGGDKRDADMILSLILAEVHNDWKEPTDLVFENVLDFELTEFFKERGVHDTPNFQN